MNTVKNKMRKIIKRAISVFVTLSMLVQYLPVNWLHDVFAAGTRPVSVSFLSSGSNLKPAGDGNYLLSSGQEMTMSVNLKPNWNENEGYARNPKVKISLPWFYYNSSGIIVSTTNPEEVLKDHPDVNFIGGIEAKAEGNGNWYTETPTADNGYVWGSDHNPSAGQEGSYRRSSLEITATDSLQFKATTTFSITFKFFTLDDSQPIPENASAPVAIGASYGSFVDNLGNVSDGYNITPGRTPQNGEDETDVRTINIINSNLDWVTSVKPVSMPVLWDKYNYGVYEVKISNISKDSKSSIDHFGFVLNVPSYTFNEQKGVLDQDMMAWKYNDSGQLEENSDISDEAKSGEFGGKYKEGGALIWDVTNKDVSNFDIDTFAKANQSEFKYSYVQSGEIGVQIGSSNDTDGNLASGASRTYYVAVPYVNNFANELTQKVILTQTIYFGGRDLAWSKKEDTTFELKKQRTSFEHEKYLVGDNNDHVQEKSVAIGKEFSYYLGGFKNTSNTPVFDAYAIDTLPEEFNITSLTIEMNNGEPKDWFDKEDLTSIISLKFNDKDSKEKWVSLKTLGVSMANDGNNWKLENIDTAIKKYLKDNEDLEFAKDVKFKFKHEIAINEAFDGRIVVSGYGKYLLNYKNKLDTIFDQWNWSPFTDLTSGQGPHYVVTSKHSSTEATAIAKSERAEPQINGYGVVHDPSDSTKDLINDNTNDDGKACQQVSLADSNAAIRFSLGNNKESKMIPSEFEISGLLTKNSNGAYAGLEASSVYLSPDLITNSKIDSIDFIGIDGTVYNVEYDTIAHYKQDDGSIKITKGCWSNKIASLGSIKINFEEFNGNVKNDKSGAYVEVNGTPNATGEYQFDGEFTTKYGSYKGLAGVKEDVVKDKAILVVKRIEPTIEATANYKGTQGEVVTAPNKSSKIDPDNPTYYQFKIGNNSESSAQNVHLIFDLLSVGNVSKDALNKKIKGFDTEKLVIKDGYTKAMDIEKIEFYEYDQNPDTDTAKWTIKKSELTNYNDNGDIVIDHFPSGMKRIKVVKIIASTFNKLVKDDDRAVVEIYGNTDSYNLYNDNKKLEANLTFKPVGKLYSDEDTREKSAAFSVAAGRLDVENDLYQENVTSASVPNSSNTDQDEKTLGVPYSRDFTYRVASWNTGISVLDDVETKIDVPTLADDQSGFHATSVTIYEDLLKQYKNFKSIEFEQKTPLLTSLLLHPSVKMTYDADNHQIINGDIKYNVSNGKFDIPIKDITNDKQYELQTIILKGENFVINKDKKGEIEPYVEIGGWSDSEITSSNILTTTSTHYLDGMEEEANKDYRITAKDTAKAYLSKLYYDTTIVAGYNDNEPTKRFSKTSTPREHVRIQHHAGQDNSELEVGYKGLGSYAVDFRQYLNEGSNLPAGEDMHSQEHQSLDYIKTTSFNTAANVKMDVSLPSDKFDAYYLRIDKRVKNYIKQIVITRKDGSTYTISKADLLKHFESTSGDYGRINLLESGDTFTKANMMSNQESDYYKSPKASYTANNPIESATIELAINQEATKTVDGKKVANEPDYGTWWNESDDSTKYMFEFSGRFYQTGNAKASVSSSVTIGGENNKGHTSSKERTTQGTSNKPRGDSWSYKNYYYWSTWSGGSGVSEYKSDHLYSENYAIVVRDYDRISKGATDNATRDYNREATIGDDNQYYINFFRNSRGYVYDDSYRLGSHYESGSVNSWYYQDPDDWYDRVGYTDHVDIVDTLGMIEPDKTYDYRGTLTTGLEFNKDIAKYFKDGDHVAVELTLGKGETQSEQQAHPTTFTLTKSQLKKVNDYYVIDFNNDNDKLSDEDAASKQLNYDANDGVLYLEKNQYVLSFKAKLYDIQGNGEYNTEIKDNYYHYKDDDGNEKNGVDDFSASDKDIVVKVKPYMVYESNSTKIQQATNTATTKTYLDKAPDTALDNVMTSQSHYPTTDSAYIMGYRIPFYAGYQLDSLGTSLIDTKDPVSASTDANKRNITEFITDTQGTRYEMLNGKNHTVTQNKTPTNAQFGVKIYNQKVADTSDPHNAPARIRELTTTDTMNTYYRMRNLYLPIQWIDNGKTTGDSATDNGQWFKLTQLAFNINGNTVKFTPEKVDNKMVLKVVPGSALKVDTIALDTIKTVNGQQCYVINIEDFARQNKKAGYGYLVNVTNGVAQVKVNNFNLTFSAKNPNFKDDATVLSNGQYLTASKENDAYSYFYDGTYVDRTEKDFIDDEWTDDSVPTFGKQGNDYSPSSNYYDTSNRDVTNKESISFKSIDNNADTFHTTSDTKNNDYYHLRNAVAILTPELTKERVLSDDTKVFAYDKDKNDETNSSHPLEVDKDHLMPYDYIEYTLSSGNHANAELPLERNHLKFTVGKGQQIVGWQLIDAEGIIDASTKATVTENEITAILKDDEANALNAKANKDYSVDNAEADTKYRTITFDVGNQGTQIPAGKTVKIRIITQLTDELDEFEGQTVKSNAYAWADNKHGYGQYAIDGYDATNYVTGTTSNNDAYPYKQNSSDDQAIEGAIKYYRYHDSNRDYIGRMASNIQFYDNKALSIQYKFDNKDREFDSQGATLTVGNIQNDTMHFIDKQTVTINFLQYKNDKTYQGFILRKLPTVSKTKDGKGDIYYPDEFVKQVGQDKVVAIKVEYTKDDPNESNAQWVEATYNEDDATIHAIKGIRWTYFNVPSGYHNDASVYSDKIDFDDVTLIGEGRYEDLRTEKDKSDKKKRADYYTSYDTATISHYKDHSEEKDAMIDDNEEKVTVKRDVTLNEVSQTTEDVYRESPQVILHPQVFDDTNEAIAKAAYDQNDTHDKEQKVGYRPNETYWQKISLVNREMLDASGTQNNRQGRLINPTIYDKFPKEYVNVVDGSIGFVWTDKDGNVKQGDYHIVSKDKKTNLTQKDYAGKMIYKKSTSVKIDGKNKKWQRIYGTDGTKAFDDLDTSDTLTKDTTYTLKTYQIYDSSNKPITMEIGDTLTIYYQLKVAQDNLPMVYVDEDRNVETKNDQHPAYFPRVGEYYQFSEDGYWGYYGYAYPFSNNANKSDAVHYREIQNSNRQMDMDYLLHDVGVSAKPNNYEDEAKVVHDNIDTWEFLKDSIVYIPGEGEYTSYENQRYGGGNGVLADYDISSTNYSQKTIYTPVQSDDVDAQLPDYGDNQTSLISEKEKKKRDWYEQVVKKRTIANDEYNSDVTDNWGSEAPIIWGENRLHLQKAWLVSASEFMYKTLNADKSLTDNDPNKEHRTYEATQGDGLTNDASNPNYSINVNNRYYSEDSRNQVHSLVDDNYEVGLEYNEEFTTKLQALNYGDWDLSGGVEFTYTMPRGIEPLIFKEDGQTVDKDKLKAEILKSVDGVTDQSNVNIKTEEVNEKYETISDDDIVVQVLQSPSDSSYSYQAPSSCQDPQWQTESSSKDYKTGSDTSPWVLKIIVKKNLQKWFNRGSDRGYKLNVYIPSKVVNTNENEEWFDRLQTKPYVENEDYEDYYYYQILDIDHFEGTTKENMQHNQRFGMDYMWYRGDGYAWSGFYANSNFYYYNGSPNTPYVDGYNIQNQEVTVKKDANGVYQATATKNDADYGEANRIDRYSQTGTRAVMRKPLLRQWTTVGDDKSGQTLSDYYLDTEGTTSKLNIHVENKYYWDSLGTNFNYYYNGGGNYTEGTKSVHSYATDGGGCGTYSLPVVTNILPYGLAPVGVKDGNSDIYSTKNNENEDRILNWDLLNIDGQPLTNEEKSNYDVKVTYEQIARKDDDGQDIKENGKTVTEGRYVVRFYPKAGVDAKILSGEGRTFTFDTFVYASPKIDTYQGDNKNLQDTYESNYTYLSSKINGFKALTDESIKGNPYTVASLAYNKYFDTEKNQYLNYDNRHDAILKSYRINNNQQRLYGKLPDNTIKDKVTNDTLYVVGQGMKCVNENDDSYPFVFNIEDYTKQNINDIETTIRDNLVLSDTQRDFNLNKANVHHDYDGAEAISDIAFVNTTKIRTRQPNLTLENFVGASKEEVGKKTPVKDENNDEVKAGSTEYTYVDNANPSAGEVTKNFDYGDEVWYSAKLTNKADDNDYAHQGSVAHSRFVFSFHLPKAVSITDLPEFDKDTDHWDQFNDDDFVLELTSADGTQTIQATPQDLEGFGIRIINKKYTPTSPEKDHTGQIVTYEVTTPKGANFTGDYSSFVNGNKPAGYLASGYSLTLKIRTRVDNKELDGIDPTNKNVDVWTGYYSEAYSTLHTTNGEYIVTDAGKIYDKDDTIPQGEQVIYDGYEFNKNSMVSHDKSFTKQVNMTWLDKKVSDSKDQTEEDGTITKGNDYDQDGIDDEDFAYCSSAYINILKPKATTRVDTSQLRKRVNDLDSETAVIDDAHVKSSDTMYMRLTEAVNDQANLNQFITSMSIPYHGTDTATSQPATLSDTEMETEIQEIRTGSWEIPANIENADIYKQHLKVYMYAYLVDDPWNEDGVIDPSENSDKWVLIGNKDGYGLEDNVVIPNTAIPNGKYIYQLNWVVKMEGFTDSNNHTYSEKNAAINYPVPVGLRLNTTGKDGKGVDELDPDRENTSDEIMHHKDVLKNCAYVSVITGPRNSSDGIAKHINYFARTFGKYDDYKYSAISTRSRAGFYVDPELPTLQIELQQAYYKATMKKDDDGVHRSYYHWDYENALIDDTTSKVLKYRVSMNNKRKDLANDITDEDNATNPNITIALPYNENLDTNKLKYASYDRNASDTVQPQDYLNDYYTSVNESLDKKTPLWTWYIVNEDGSIADPSAVKPVQITDDSPLVKTKSIAASRKEKNKILNFYFTGQLKPGQSLKVEIMVPVERMNSNAISAELLRCKGYIFKKGAFRTFMPDQGDSNSSAYEYDSQDVNENKRYNDAALTKMTTAIGFSQTEALGQSKLVDTELEPNVTSRPAAVNEGGDYTFKVSSTSLSDATSYQYTNNVIYDVLPYDGDYYAYTTSDNEKVKRNSKWNGWLNLDSIHVKNTAYGKETEVASDQYDVWVGPIVNENGKYVLKTNDDGSPILPDQNNLKKEQYAQLIASSDNTEKQKYFVKLSDLKAYLKTVDEDEQDKLTKGIRAIWLQMKDDYTIQPGGRLEMSYTMHAPQNVKKYVGDVKVDDSLDTSTSAQISAAVKDLVGWNSFLSRAYSKANEKFENIESSIAGVYVDAPSDRGYIGSYVWQDVNYNGKIDEGTYEDTYGIGRKLLKEAKYDLDNDGKNDDPGINGVKVELLTENGRPANKEGEAIKVINGKYIILNDKTGEPELLDADTDHPRYRYSTSGPATYTTESDYYGNKGYFVFSNLKPGKYNLRYTLPNKYKDYSITTKELNKDDATTPVIIYRDGKVVYGQEATANDQQAAYKVSEGTLVAQTAQSIQVDAVEEDADQHQAYDEKAMGYDLGVGRTRLYKGTAWLDETIEANGEINIDGKMDSPQAEKRLKNIKVEAYEVDPKTSQPISDTPAIDADGNVASYVTKDTDNGDLKAGEYQFRLVPGKTYIIKATNESGTPLKATAPVFAHVPTLDTKNNDLLLQGGQLITNQFDVPYLVGKEINDWEDYPKEHTIDLGFVNSARGFIGELVWNDENYNGIQDPNEDPIKGVTVTLEQYYYKDDKWHKLSDEKTTQTNDAGVYKFTVSTYKEVDGKNYLMGYKVRIDRDDNEELFKNNAPTFKGKTNDGKQSDLAQTSKDNNSYYLTDQVVIIAGDVSDTTQDKDKVTYDGTEYDLGNAETKNFDAGFKNYESGKIDGIVWLDENYNGIRENDEKVTGTLTDDQQKLSNIKAKITGYYYDDGSWKKAKDWSTNDVSLVLADDGYYHYTFEGLPTESLIKVKVNGKDEDKVCLMSYKVTLDESTVDKTLKPTLKYQTDTNKDSNLTLKDNSYSLMEKDDYVIIAKKLSDDDEKHTGTLETVGNDIYDMLQHQDIKDYDAGLTAIDPGTIRGQVWIDQNYDGIQDDDEESLEGIKVKLVRYLVTQDSDGKFVYTKDEDFDKDTAVTKETMTDKDGKYSFTKLAGSPNDGSRLYAYQVMIDTSDSDNQAILEQGTVRLGITKYHQGGKKDKDSDWSNNGTLIDNDDDYLILLNKANDKTPTANNVMDYDIVKGKAYDNLNAGATPYQNAKISGNIFDDLDYDGLNTDKDDVMKQLEITLKQYYIDENDQYIEIPSGKRTTQTNDDGDYTFDSLPTNGYVNGKRVLYAYTVSLENLPSDYVVTKYHKDGKRYSNIDPHDQNYTLKDKSNNPYIILAKKSNNDKLAQYYKGYDLIENSNKSDFDGGITKFHKGTIIGTIFDDEDYDGLLGKDDKGYEGINVILTQYQKVGDEYYPTGMIDSVTTDENGKYTFENVETNGMNEENQRVLYAYRITLDESTIPDGYGVTRYRVNDKNVSSKLSSTNYELISNKENQYKDSQEPYIIMASKTDDTDVPYYVDGYDLVGSQSIKELNGGITKIQTGSISGTIFEDEDYDGLSKEDDQGFSNIEISLKQYYLKDNKYVLTENEYTCKTAKDGSYKFDQLPTHGIENDEQVVYYYKAYVNLESLPEDYAITKYHIGSDDTQDSDLLSETGELLGQDQYMILVNKADKNNEQCVVDGYDVIASKDYTNLDGGLIKYGQGTIEGTLWIDDNRNGVIDQSESYLAQQKMILKGYYYKDNQWIEEISLSREVETDQNGHYQFNHLVTSISKDKQTYLVGYQVSIAELPKNKEITEYLKNNGIKDSKLTQDSLRLIYNQYEKDGYLILADSFDDDNINNQSYKYRGLNIIKAIDIKDMNAGFYDPDSPIRTGDHTSIMRYVIIGLISLGIVVLIGYKKRKENE